MSTLTYIIVVAGCGLLAFWLVVAVGMGIGMFWGRRAATNTIYARVARMFGKEACPVGRLRWSWIAIRAVPLQLIGAIIITADFFIRLLVGGYCWITGRPTPQPPRLDDINNDG